LVVGEHRLITASEQFEGPFITKHNQGGKGLGIQLYNSKEEFKRSVLQQGVEPSPDGKYILQQYISPAREQITRVEIVGDKFLFAMNSSTKDGFELCPSDVCQMQLLNQGPDVCPIDGSSDKFSISHLEVHDPLVQYIRLMKDEQIDVAGIEFVEASDGQRYTYDINGTTNYNSTLGEQIGISGMDELVKYIQQRLVA
jgi:glutathione synthase/RimK-type ligase-like ATP-grasp enzyme